MKKKKVKELSICAACCDCYSDCACGHYLGWETMRDCKIEGMDILAAVERGDLKIRRSLIRQIKRDYRKWSKRISSPLAGTSRDEMT